MNNRVSQAGQFEEQRKRWLRALRRNGYYVRHVAIVTLVLGAFAHAAVIAWGRTVLPQIVTPTFELVLVVLMIYVSIMGWFAWPTFRFRGPWQKLVLALILVYFPLGLPFHLITIMTGNTNQYLLLPEWYSLLILPMMVGMIIFFARLRPASTEDEVPHG